MKRVLLLVVVLAALIAAAWFFLMPRGTSEGAQLVPADSVFYVTLPDVQRTINRWPKTALAQIAAEPAVADFLQKPIAQLATGGGLEAMDLLFRVKPGRLFLAVTAMRQNGAQALLGFQFLGGRKDVDAAMERLYRELGKTTPNSATAASDYHGDTVTTFSGATPLFFSASHGSWAFIANHEAVLRQALDRAAGRAGSPSLAATDDFKKVSGHLSRDPDFLWYGKLQPIADLLVELGKQQNAAANARQFDQLRKMKALGGTLLLDGANQKEISFVLYPDAPKLPSITRAGMALTTPETSIFFDSSIDTKTMATDEYFQALPPGAQTFLTNAKVDLKQIPEIFGSDLGLVFGWPAGAMIPSVLFALEIKDRPRVQAMVESLLAGFGLPAAPAASNGASVFALPAAQLQLIDPQVAVSDKFLFASLTSAELNRALTLPPGAPTLEGAGAFKPALAAYQATGQAFGYVDSKALFERVYNMVRPIAIFAGAMSPTAGQFVDVQKMPDTETISKHLAPILYTSAQTADGVVIESSGPLTLTQAAALVGGGAAAAYLSQFASGLPH